MLVCELPCAIGTKLKAFFWPEIGIDTSQNHCSCQFADKWAERGYYNKINVILCGK